MVANPCLLCLSSNSQRGKERKISSLLNLVLSDERTNDVPGRDDARLVVCSDCDKLLDSATEISNSISQLQIQLRIKINDIRAIILKSGKNFGDGESNLNIEISKMRKSFLECLGNDKKTAFSEIQEITTEQEVEVDCLGTDLVWLPDKNIGHDPLSPTSASFLEANNEMEIGETEIKIEISEDEYVIEAEPIKKRKVSKRLNPNCELDSKNNFKDSQMKSVSSPTIQNIVRKQTKVQMMLKKAQKSTGSRTNLNFTPTKFKFSMNKERQPLYTSALICTTCKEIFDGKGELEAHITAKHKTAEGFHCDICKQLFGRKIDLERHMDQHGYEERTFVCEKCDRRYTNQNNLDAHIEIMHRMEIPLKKKESKRERQRKDHFCPICDRKFQLKDQMIVHIFDEHETEDKPFSCSKCAKSFTLEMNLQRHLELHKFEETQPVICEKCDGRFKDQEALDLHKLKRHNESVHCQYCQKEFVTFGALYSHLRLHTGDKRYSCPNCPELFFKQMAKQRHIEKVHQKDQKHPCNLCDAQFDTSDGLKAHLMRHEGKYSNYRIACEECGETFKKSATLETHQVKVHGKDPVICDECGTSCPNKIGLKKHKFTVHGGIRKYKCDICPKSFEKLSMLEIHSRAHKNERPYICAYCAAGFISNSTLKNHEKKIHCPDYTPKYNFSCPDCDKRFQEKRDMEGHIRFAHTGERPFVCKQPNCDKSYCAKTALDLHLKRIHGISQQPLDKYLCPNCDNQFGAKHDMDRHIRRMHTGEKPFACQQPNCDRKYFDKRSLNDHLKRAHGIIQQPTTSRRPFPKRDNISPSSPSSPSSAGTKRKRDQMSQDSSLNDLNEMEH